MTELRGQSGFSNGICVLILQRSRIGGKHAGKCSIMPEDGDIRASVLAVQGAPTGNGFVEALLRSSRDAIDGGVGDLYDEPRNDVRIQAANDGGLWSCLNRDDVEASG